MNSQQYLIKAIKTNEDDVELTPQHRFSIPQYLLILLQTKYGTEWYKKLQNKTIKIPHCPLNLCVEYENYLTTDFNHNFLKNTFLEYNNNDLLYYLNNNSEKQILKDIKAIKNKSSISNNIVKLVAMYMGYKVINTETKSFNESAEKTLKIDFSIERFMNNPIYKYKPNKSNKDYDSFFSNVEGWCDYNVKLIKNVKTDTANKVKDIVISGFKAGDIRSEELVEYLVKATNYSKTRVKTIARDQISKLYGQKNKAQALAIGLRRYKWKTCLDERVRESHMDREGRVYLFDEGINPGEEINCRCVAETLLDWKN